MNVNVLVCRWLGVWLPVRYIGWERGCVAGCVNLFMYALDSNNINWLSYKDDTSNLIKVDSKYECECLGLSVSVCLAPCPAY